MNTAATSRKNPKVYLYVWLPLAAVVFYLLKTTGEMSTLDSVALAIPLCIIGQFETLSARYICKITPLQKAGAWRITGTHVVAAQIVALIWVGVAKALAYLLAQEQALRGLDARFAGKSGIIYVAGLLFYFLAVAYFYVMMAQDASHAAEARVLETSVLAREAELKALKAQLNPHFLFNSLNSISALTSIDPARAREMCLLLADFLRTTLKLGEKSLIPLSEELGLLERFLAIEKVRFGARLNMEMNVEDNARGCMIPTLLLQPLVENAVGHGIAKLTEGGIVRLAAEKRNGRLAITVENSMDPDAAPSRKGGVGLRNVQERLEARYGKEATLRAMADEDIFRVNLSMPAEVEEKA